MIDSKSSSAGIQQLLDRISSLESDVEMLILESENKKLKKKYICLRMSNTSTTNNLVDADPFLGPNKYSKITKTEKKTFIPKRRRGGMQDKNTPRRYSVNPDEATLKEIPDFGKSNALEFLAKARNESAKAREVEAALAGEAKQACEEERNCNLEAPIPGAFIASPSPVDTLSIEVFVALSLAWCVFSYFTWCSGSC